MKDLLWLLAVLVAIPVAVVIAGIIYGGVDWVHKLITQWLFRK